MTFRLNCMLIVNTYNNIVLIRPRCLFFNYYRVLLSKIKLHVLQIIVATYKIYCTVYVVLRNEQSFRETDTDSVAQFVIIIFAMIFITMKKKKPSSKSHKINLIYFVQTIITTKWKFQLKFVILKCIRLSIIMVFTRFVSLTNLRWKYSLLFSYFTCIYTLIEPSFNSNIGINFFDFKNYTYTFHT